MFHTFWTLLFILFFASCTPETKVDQDFFEDYLDSISDANFSVSNNLNGSKVATSSTTVQVHLLNDAKAVGWCLTESSTLASIANCPSGTWLTSRPSTFNLSAGDGTKNVHLWLKNKNDVLSSSPRIHSILLDTQAPTVTFTTPLANAYVNNIAKSNFNISGTCSDNGHLVTISGAANTSAICIGNTFSKNLNLSSSSDGAVTLNLSHVDTAGNVVNGVTRSFIKDTIGPSITQTGVENQELSNQNQNTFSGACEDGSSISITGEDTASVSCTASTWSYQTNSESSDGLYSYQFNASDAAGNTTSITGSWRRDTVSPALSLFEIADGAINIGTISTFVKIGATDDQQISSVRFADANFVTNNCDTEYANNSWQDYTSGVASYSYIIAAGDGEKKICAWAKDSAGNISSLGNIAGVQGTSMDTVLYEVGNIPQVTSFSVQNNSAGANFGTQKFNLNEEVLINWTASDIEGLADNPIKLEYTTNNSTWITITSAYGGINPTSPYSGSYTFNAPTASYFRVRLFVKDKANNSSMEYRSQPLNSGQWSIYAGTNAIGLGGSFNSVQLSKASYDNAYGDAAVNPKNGDVYFYSYGKGLYKSNAITGVVEKYMGASGTNIGSKLVVDANTNISVVPTMKFDGDGNLYLKVTNTIYRINTQTHAIKYLFGGGASNTPPYTSSSLFISARTDYDLDLSKNIYFFIDCALPGPWANTNNNSVKIAKATYDAGSDSYIFSDYAGNCTLADPASGSDALTNPLGRFMYQHLLSLTVNSDGSLIYYGQGTIRKIYNGVIYSTKVGSNMGVSLDKVTNTLYGASGKLNKYTDTAVASANSETETTLMEVTGGANCNEDGTLVSSGCVNIYHGNAKGNVFTGFNQEVYFVDLGARVRLLNPKNQRIYTLMGTKAIYGIGQDKSLLRAQWPGGMYYKKATELNQVLFPEGLYFTDEYSMTINHIHPTTGIVTTVAGNQSLVQNNSSGVSFNSSTSLGSQHSNQNLASLTFDEQGLPWFVTDSYLRNVESDGKMYRKQTGSTRWSQAVQGSNPANFIATYFYGLTNLSVSNGGVFVTGQSYAQTETLLNAPVVQFHDFTTSVVQHMMGGGATTNVGFTPDNSAPGAQINLPLTSNCLYYSCYNFYDSDANIFYFSETNKIRSLTNPKTPSSSTLTTLIDAGREIRNFIFSEDGDQVYYISSDGKLYCKDVDGVTPPAHCNNTDLGPASGLSIITSRPNQLTWKSSTELLINSRSGEIYLYKVP